MSDCKIFDFGLVKDLEHQLSSNQSLTRTGEVCGTPEYLAPELCLGRSANVRSDLYAIGCLLYFMVTGRPPFDGVSMGSMMLKHVQETPKPVYVARGDEVVYAKLEKVLNRALAKNPDDRYQSAEEFASDLVDVGVARPLGRQERKTIAKSYFAPFVIGCLVLFTTIFFVFRTGEVQDDIERLESQVARLEGALARQKFMRGPEPLETSTLRSELVAKRTQLATWRRSQATSTRLFSANSKAKKFHAAVVAYSKLADAEQSSVAVEAALDQAMIFSEGNPEDQNATRAKFYEKWKYFYPDALRQGRLDDCVAMQRLLRKAKLGDWKTEYSVLAILVNKYNQVKRGADARKLLYEELKVLETAPDAEAIKIQFVWMELLRFREQSDAEFRETCRAFYQWFDGKTFNSASARAVGLAAMAQLQ